ncbi:MAG: hypothetical protein MJZ74_03140 [Muribaculaceae bacterium]|nr:hypothetical protein [Muribaculaceae bacterium]
MEKLFTLCTIAVLALTSFTANAKMYIFFGGMNNGDQKLMAEDAPGVYTYTFAESGGYHRFFFTTTNSSNWDEVCANRYGSGQGHDVSINLGQALPVVQDNTGYGCYSYTSQGRLNTITYDTNNGTVNIDISPLYVWNSLTRECTKMKEEESGIKSHSALYNSASYFVFTTKAGNWDDVKDNYRIAPNTGDNYEVTENIAAPAVKDNTGNGGYHFNGNGIRYTIKYNPKTEQITVVPAEKQDVYLYGSFDWTAGHQRKMTETAPGVYTINVSFNAGGSFYFTTSMSGIKDVIDNYRYGPDRNDITAGEVLQLTMGSPAAVTKTQKGDLGKFQLAEAGNYNITYDTNKGTVVAVPSNKKEMYFYTSLDNWLAGSQHQMTEIAPGVFKYTFTATDGAAFYFTEVNSADKALMDMYRYGAGSDVTLEMGVAQNCVKVNPGTGAYYVQGAGTYTVTFDTNTGKVLVLTGTDMYIRLVDDTDWTKTHLEKMTETAPNVFTYDIELNSGVYQRFNFYTTGVADDNQRYGGNTGSDVTVAASTEYNVVKDTHSAGCYTFTNSESIPYSYTVTYDANRGKLTVTPRVSQKMYVYTQSAMASNGYSQEMTETAPGVYSITGDFSGWFYLTNVYSNDKNLIDRYRYAAGQGVESMVTLDEAQPAVRIDVSSGSYGKYNFQPGIAGTYTITYNANNQTVVVTLPYEAGKQFDYASKTYTWYDADGGIHTSALTDRATDPLQMMALLNKVYTDHTIPGSRNVDGEDGDDFIYNDEYERLPYFDQGFIPQPEEGFTALLVEMKNKESETDIQHVPFSAEDFKKNIKSIQLISNVTESDKAYVMSISGSFDRFYIIGKGKARYRLNSGELAPSALWASAGFERLSPTGNGEVAGSPDLYPRLMAGESYRITHDCADLLDLGHYMLINPGEGNDPYLKNITLYVPKDRMRYWDENTPWVDENGVTHDGGFVWPNSSGESRDSNGRYTWYNPNTCPMLALYQAQLQGNISTPNNGQCTVNLDWISTLKNSFDWDGGETYEVYIVLPDGTRQLLTMQNDDTYYSYMVDQQEQSYTIQYEVVCYPTDSKGNKVGPAVTNIVTLTVPGTGDDFKITHFYRSRFNVASLLNSYKNRIVLTPYNFTAPASGEATRKVMRMKQDGSDVKEIATITIKADETYAISYNNAMATDASWRYDKNPLETSGSITNGNSIAIIDYFLASTAQGGDLAGSYIYYITGGKQSGQVEVPVYSSNLNSSYVNEYTVDMIDSDTDRSLNLNDKANVAFDDKSGDAKYNAVNSWDIYQGKTITFLASQSVNIDLTNNELNSYTGQMTVNSQYGTNTYGTNTTHVQGAMVELVGQPYWNTYNKAGYTDTNVYGAELMITPYVADEVAPYVLYYRIWREETDDNKTTILNNLKDSESIWSGTNYNSIETIYPDMSENFTLREVYLAPSYNHYNGGKKHVTYTLRMYCTTQPKANQGGNNAPANANMAKMYITETSHTIEYRDGMIVTGISDVEHESNILDVTYYNMTGIASDKPFSGINLQVTRYTDGTTKTSKVIK